MPNETFFKSHMRAKEARCGERKNKYATFPQLAISGLDDKCHKMTTKVPIMI